MTRKTSTEQVSTEYTRKLNQQLVHKENVVKLLQLQVKNQEQQINDLLNAQRDGDGDRIKRQLAAAREEVDRLKKRLEAPEGGANGSRPGADARVAELEAELVALRERLSEGEADGEGEGRKVDQLWAEVRRLTDDLAAARCDRDDLVETVERLKLAESTRGDGTRRQKELEAERDRLEGEKQRLEGLLASLREGRDRDPLLVEGEGRVQERIEDLEREATRLRRENQRLQERQDDQRVKAAAERAPDSFRLVKSVIDFFQALDDARVLDGNEGLREQEAQIAALMGIERIPCVAQPFDEERHQVVEVLFSAEHPHGTIVRELGRGYLAGGRVIKPADVVVSRNPYWCPSCQSAATEGGRFCHLCGERLPGPSQADEAARGRDDDATSRTLAFLELGQACERAGDLDGARAQYQRVLELDADGVRALEGLLRVEELEGRYEEAVLLCERIEALGTRLPQARRRLETKMAILGSLKSLV